MPLRESPSNQELRRAANRHVWLDDHDWSRTEANGGPMIAVKGDGVRVTDSEGRSWIDASGGQGAVNIGYGRTEFGDIVYEQAAAINYMPQRSAIPSTIDLVRKLAEITPGTLSRTFPVSSGAEANETAIKVARAYHKRNGEPARYKIISRFGSYHGDLGLVQWLGSSPDHRNADYEPAYPGMVYAPQPNVYRYGSGDLSPSECAVHCAKAVEDLIKFHQPSTVAAVIAEPVTNDGIVPGPEYWPMLREICNEYGIVLIADEVTTGLGRTGKMFGVDHWGVEPDIMTMAGGLSGGYMPIGATTATTSIADRFATTDSLFRHVFTFAGHPVAASVALKSIEIIESEGLVENAAASGEYLMEALTTLTGDHPIVGDVRGLGLLCAIELVSDRAAKAGFGPETRMADRLTAKFSERGLILPVRGNVIPITPPLTVTRAEIDEIMHAIDLALWEIEGELGIASMA
ncbi:MAG: aspartate aminotransferase family protein [Dehalococcoidia bacterium]|nr:aspartate aminotransferase family protein [Dehalococcoidia bacterium]